MRPVFPPVAHYISYKTALLSPFGLLAAGTLCAVATPLRHSLLVTGVAWLAAAAYFGWRTRQGSRNSVPHRSKLGVLAGLLYGLAQVCERVGADRENYWWTKALLPSFAYYLLQVGLEHELGRISYVDTGPTVEKSSNHVSRLLVLTATVASAVALSAVWISPVHITLGVTSCLLTATSLLLFEELLRTAKYDAATVNSIDRLPSRRSSMSAKEELVAWISMRDMTFVAGVTCFVASLMTEHFRNDGITYRPTWRWEKWATDTRERQPAWNVWRDLFGIVIELVYALFLLGYTREQGTLQTTFLSLGSTLLAHLATGFTWSGLWQTALYATVTLLVFDENAAIEALSSHQRRRTRYFACLFAAAGFLTLLLLRFRTPYSNSGYTRSYHFPSAPPKEALAPLEIADTTVHPVAQLVREAKTQLQVSLDRQSQTLDQAAAEYRRRYSIPPPPKFDSWFEFAKRRNVRLVDEFDTIHHSLLPFWALEPSVIRSRVAEAIGFKDNFLIAVLVREGQIVKFEGGEEWHQKAIMGMMRDFVHYLPDMDLAFNIHDEPRVILPNDLLSRLVKEATEQKIPAAARQLEPKNMFSTRPADMTDGKRVKEVKMTQFNKFAHQQTWANSKLSCSLDSPARGYSEISKDNLTAYALTELGFVYNHTAFNDICLAPSLRDTFGFFERPNAYNIIQDLLPVFSQSKISSYQDILYPSPWYWANKVEYDAESDVDWSRKESKLYWRGSTTGGFSRNGGWRRQHRQRVVRKINDLNAAWILEDRERDPAQEQAEKQVPKQAHDWQPLVVRRQDYEDLIDVKFSHVGQCDPGDCAAQKEFFDVVERVEQQDAWQYKHLLDMDGNAFSGRFYAFLRSNSLVFKMSLFQEWHKDWLRPWAHYIPWSLRGDEWLETVRYLTNDEGKELAPRLASESKAWANAVLRNEDLEVWFFRLLLEYGRLIDDNRETIGYPGP